ncbi:hypothetical protein [Flammeovirga aprica]|uniref:DUF4625 domain-containing protein n=1 Tax=Flammeovirga aprica JL-4 TaxID=694437 RepID=A0A7X9RW66_9BACT|nr:hypothetical protein [Flammeovirga aprica]NME69833.1 hypothetical protein [Flammeovirga aprica JL-4]
MNLSVKLILVSLFLSSLFSCSTTNDELFPETFEVNQLPQIDPIVSQHFINVSLVPNGPICDKEIMANVEIIDSQGNAHNQVVVAKNGIIDFTYDKKASGNYSVVFKDFETNQLMGSVSFYLSDIDMNKDYYLKTIEYSNCNF